MPDESSGGTTPSRTVRRLRRFLMRSWQAIVVGTVVLALGVLAFLSPGLVQADVRLDEGTVHVAKRDDGRLGVLNAQIDEFAAQTTVGDSDFEILQDGNLVLVHGTASSTLGEYEPARNRLTSPKQLPGDATVHMGGGTLLVLNPDNGKAWFGDPQSVLDINFQEQKAQLEVGEFGNATVTSAGDVIGLDVQRSVLVRPGADGPVDTPLPFTLDPNQLEIEISAVGDKAVVLDRASGRIWVEGMDKAFEVSGVTDAQLLPPAADALGGQDGARAVYATRAGLIALTVDGPRSLTGNLDAAPIRPIEVGGCVYSVFGEEFVRLCRGEEPRVEEIPQVPTGDDRALAFQVNRSTVVLNDLVDGTVWMVDKGMTRLTWDNVIPPEDVEEDELSETETVIPPDREKANQVPIAKDDDLAARAGRSTILTVLDNDSDPDGDVLTITALSQPDGATLQPVRGGTGLQVTVDSETTGTLTFSYSIDDGRRGKATADVTLRIVSPDADVDNGAPFKQARAQPATIGLGKKITKRVLMDWRDPDGDSLILVDAKLPKDASDEISFTPDGEVTFRDVGISTGTKKVKITVSDGFVESDGEMVVVVTDDVVPPIAYGDFETMALGTTITVSPLANDVGENLSLTEVLEEKPAECDCAIVPNYQEQLFSFTPKKAGIHYVTYKVSNGPVAMGLVRIDVRKEATNHPPVAALDVALLPPGGSVMIDPVLNDTDEDGDVLVVQSVSQHPGLRVTLQRRHLVTIETIHAPDGPVTLTYRLSDGKFSVLGTIVVLPTSSGGSPQPQATRDNARIRAGTTQSIDVLANDTSPVGLPLTLDEIVDNPGNRAWIHGDRIRVSVPASTQSGSIRLTYQVSDSEGRITSAEVVVAVVSEDAQNLPPQPRAVEERVLANTTSRLIIPTDGIDPNGDAVRLIGLGSGPQLGRVLAVGDGWLTYEAYPESKGTDVFSYQVIDASGVVGVGEIRVGVAPAGPDNTPPTGIADDIEVRPGRHVQIPALRNDVDIDGDAITYVALNPVKIDGIVDVEIIENREISFVAPEEEGTHVGTYWIEDARGEQGSGDLRIVVDKDAPLLPPEARDDVVPVSAVAGEEWVDVDVTANDFDPDGRQEDLRVEVPDYGVPEESSASATKDKRKVTVPVTDQMQQIRYTLVDTDGLTATGLILVPGRNDSVPVLKDPGLSLEVRADQKLDIDINAYVNGTDSRTVRLTGADSITATHGRVQPVGGERVQYTPDLDYEGPASVVFAVGDVTTENDTPSEAYISIPVKVLPAPNRPDGKDDKDLEVARTSPELIGEGMPTLRVGPGEDDVRLDLMPLFRDGDGDAFFFRNFAHVSGDKSIEYQESGDGSKLVARAPINAKPGTVRILRAEVVDANEGKTPFEIRLEVVSSTRPLATTVTDVREARAGVEISVPVLTNDKSNLVNKPQLTLTDRPVIVTGSGAIRVDGDVVKIIPSEGFVGTLTARYSVMDATEDPKRQVDGTIRITVKDRPSRPGVPRDGVAGNGTVTFTYTPGSSNGYEIDGRIATAISASGQEVRSAECRSTTCTVTGLPNGFPYRFTVKEKNEAGISEPSLLSAAYTPDVKPNAPPAPSNTFGDRQMTVAWQRPTWADPTNPGSALTQYTVALLGEGGQQIGLKENLPPGSTSYTWTGLTNGTPYRFKVLAGNNAGLSPFSEMSNVDWPAGPPGASPTINATATENPLGGAFDVAWASAGVDPNGDRVKDFIVTPVTEQGPQTQLARTVAATGAATQSVLVEGLGQKPYKFTVEATNKAGKGAAAATAQWQTAWELPKIESFSAAASNGTIQMGVKTNFEGRVAANPRIQYTLNGGEWRPYPSAGRATGLTNGQVYDVAVRVVIDGDRASGSQTRTGLMPRSDAPAWSTLDESSFAFQGFSGGAAQVYVRMEKPATLVASGGWDLLGYWFSCGGDGVRCSPSGTTRSNDFVVSSGTLMTGPAAVKITMGHQGVGDSTTSSAFTLSAPFTGTWNSTSGALNVQLNHVRSATCRATGVNVDKTFSQGGGTSMAIAEVFPAAEGLPLPSRVDVACTFGNNRSATLQLWG